MAQIFSNDPEGDKGRIEAVFGKYQKGELVIIDDPVPIPLAATPTDDVLRAFRDEMLSRMAHAVHGFALHRHDPRDLMDVLKGEA